MKAVILAAGLGTRMEKAFPHTPKSLLPILGKPLIEDQIKHLKKFGIRDFYVNLYFHAKKITDFLGDGSKLGVNIIYSFERKLLGTSGALNNFKDYLNQTFIVLYGDIFTRLDFNKFLKFHKDKSSQATLSVHTTNHPQDSDLVKINKDARIEKFFISPHAKPVTDTKLSSAAIYILEPEILQFLPKGFSDFLKDFFPTLLSKGVRMYGYESNEYSKDIGTPERYKEVKRYIANNLLI